MRKTKIIATMGPAISSYKIFKDCVVSGMNAVRLNMSHGTREQHQIFVDYAKQARKELGVSLPIIVDTRGPEIRVGNFENDKVSIKKSQLFTFTTNKVVGNTNIVSLNMPSIIKNISVGGKILANNGLLSFKVVEKTTTDIKCKALNSGILSNHKSLFLPGVEYSCDYLNEADKQDIIWAVEQGVEYVACSFVNHKEDILQVKQLISKYHAHTQVISKIESKLGVKNLDEIINVSDGIMVARGDLGVEISQSKIPALQKNIITKSRLAGKIVITATEMLESMVNNPRPTRAETSDVANAVYDGTSIVMLSGETAVGKYPSKTIKTMSDICLQAEKSTNYQKIFNGNPVNTTSIHDAISYSAVATSFCTNAKNIVVLSDSGNSAKLVSRFRPHSNIVVITYSSNTYHLLGLSWGVTPVLKKCTFSSLDKMITLSNTTIKEMDLAKTGDVIVIVSASRYNDETTDIVKLHVIK